MEYLGSPQANATQSVYHSLRFIARLIRGAIVERIDVVEINAGTLDESSVVVGNPITSFQGEIVDTTIKLYPNNPKAPVAVKAYVRLPEVQRSRITVVGAGLVMTG